MVELWAAEMGEPGRSAVSHLANVIARSGDGGPELAWRHERAAGDALRAYPVESIAVIRAVQIRTEET